MRILIIHNHYQDSGGEDVVFEQENALLSQSMQVETLRYVNRKGLLGLIQFALYPWNIGAARRAVKKAERFKPDVVHIHNFHYAAGPLLIRALRKRNIPVVMTLHNYRLLCPTAILYHSGELFMDSAESNFPWKAVRQRVHSNSIVKTFWVAFTYYIHRKWGTWNKVSRYFVLTQFAQNLFHRYRPEIPEEKFVVKPNFLPDPSSKSEADMRQAHFLFVGRLSEEKGICTLLNAFRDNEYTLRIAGDGPLAELVQKAAQQHTNIQYLGRLGQEQVIDEMRVCTALIFPSVWFEGMPMTLIQAFASATPVIASHLGAMRTMIREGKEGYLFEPGNAGNLRQVVTHWQNLEKTVKQQIGKAARTAYEVHYTPLTNIELMTAHYRASIQTDELIQSR